MTEQYIKENADTVDWLHTSSTVGITKFSDDFFERFKEKIFWDNAILRLNEKELLSDFPVKYWNYVNWSEVFRFHMKSLDRFISKHKDKIDKPTWRMISAGYIMTEEFIWEHEEYIVWPALQTSRITAKGNFIDRGYSNKILKKVRLSWAFLYGDVEL